MWIILKRNNRRLGTTGIRISVIVPAQYIERCAESLFSQTLREGIEFIFVDDRSLDSSVEIVEKLLSRYPYRESQTRIVRQTRIEVRRQ